MGGAVSKFAGESLRSPLANPIGVDRKDCAGMPPPISIAGFVSEARSNSGVGVEVVEDQTAPTPLPRFGPIPFVASVASRSEMILCH